uniref:Uncharacterized protein n=1 Tax=Panagrellus redivivus TaxID=6233 RepID=A0A7E4VF91_PANRE
MSSYVPEIGRTMVIDPLKLRFTMVIDPLKLRFTLVLDPFLPSSLASGTKRNPCPPDRKKPPPASVQAMNVALGSSRVHAMNRPLARVTYRPCDGTIDRLNVYRGMKASILGLHAVVVSRPPYVK